MKKNMIFLFAGYSFFLLVFQFKLTGMSNKFKRTCRFDVLAEISSKGSTSESSKKIATVNCFYCKTKEYEYKKFIDFSIRKTDFFDKNNNLVYKCLSLGKSTKKSGFSLGRLSFNPFDSYTPAHYEGSDSFEIIDDYYSSGISESPKIHSYNKCIEKIKYENSSINRSDIIGNNSIYFIEIFNENSFKLAKRSTGRVLFYDKVNGSICSLGATVALDGNHEKNDKDFSLIDCVFMHYLDLNSKHYIRLYSKLDKVVFQTEFNYKLYGKVLSYKILKTDKKRFLAVVFSNIAILFDIEAGKIIANKDFSGAINTFVFDFRHGYIIFIVNKDALIIDEGEVRADAKCSFFEYNCQENIVDGFFTGKYFVFRSANSEFSQENIINIVDFEENNNNIYKIESFWADSYGMLNFSGKSCFYKKNKLKDNLLLYAIFKNKLIKIFENKFEEKFIDFDLVHNIDANCFLNVHFEKNKIRKFKFSFEEEQKFYQEDFSGTGSPGTGSPGTGSPGTGFSGTGSPGIGSYFESGQDELKNCDNDLDDEFEPAENNK